MNIINGRQKKGKKFIEMLITFVGWIYLLLSIIQIILSFLVWIFNINLIRQYIFIDNYVYTVKVTFFVLILSIIILLISLTWGMYNKRRFGPLRRRKFPTDVTQKEIAEYFYLDYSLVKEMQRDYWIEIEEPVMVRRKYMN